MTHRVISPPLRDAKLREPLNPRCVSLKSAPILRVVGINLRATGLADGMGDGVAARLAQIVPSVIRWRTRIFCLTPSLCAVGH
jgi:hypothetical protein